MGLLDRLFGMFGRDDRSRHHGGGGYGAPQNASWQQPARGFESAPSGPQFGAAPGMGGNGMHGARGNEELALQRYRYLLQTAPPERIEQAHAEAFEQLTPQQRHELFERLSAELPPGEAPYSDDPHSLAQAATRQELRRPGFMEGMLASTPAAGDGMSGRGGPAPAGQGGGMLGGFTDRFAGGDDRRGGQRGGGGFGSMLGASLLGTVGGYVIGSALMSSFLPAMGGFGGVGEGEVVADAAGGTDLGGGAGDFDASGGFRDGGDAGAGGFEGTGGVFGGGESGGDVGGLFGEGGLFGGGGDGGGFFDGGGFGGFDF